MRIALVDDSRQALDTLRQRLTERMVFLTSPALDQSDNEILTFTDGESLLKEFMPGSYDLICLDIYMENIGGIETARLIRERDEDVPIVFITTSNDFASESYAVHAAYYLLKPYTENDLDRMLMTVLPVIASSARILSLPDGTRIPVDSIIYADNQGHYATLHLRGNRQHRLRINHTDLEKLLSSYDCFCSCFKGVLVNFRYVEGFTKDQIILKGGSFIPVSRRRYAAIKQEFAEYTFRQLQRM